MQPFFVLNNLYQTVDANYGPPISMAFKVKSVYQDFAKY